MAEIKRTSRDLRQHADIGTGPYLARIVNHLDPTYMGALEVTLLRSQGNIVGDDTQTYVVKCAMPFFGYTGYEFMGNNSASNNTLDGFSDTQKSYGMWFVPPDVGVNVLVMFVDGDPAQGYWMGCVPSRYANHMVPAIAGSQLNDCDSKDKAKYNTSQPLPVAEINRRLNSTVQEIDVKKIKRPVHPIADRFLEQGLLDDDIRGVTTSSSRREVPSMVFGISTPGPLDRRPGAKKSIVGKHQGPSPTPIPVSRLGGTQFVMDDGDERYQRATHAGKGPVKYVDASAGEKGEPTIPYNEYFRVRTRTGHQILMHNSEDLIYISNSRGTAWVELSSNGKIDIFSEDSISIHSKNDLNIRSDRDINMEAGRNINIKATAEYQSQDKLYESKNIFDGSGNENGRVYIESAQNMDLLVGRNGKIHVRNNEQIQGNFDIKVMGNMRISVQDKDNMPSHTNVKNLTSINANQTEGVKGLHIQSFENTRITTSKNLDIDTKQNTKLTTGQQCHIHTKGSKWEYSPIYYSVPSAGATGLAQRASSADISDIIRPLQTHENPITDLNLDWATKRYQVTDKKLRSIMKRIPMHEPWTLHDNQAPLQLTPENTDREK